MADDLHEVRRALRRAEDRKKKQAKRRDEDSGLTWQRFHTALCIGLLADYDMRAAAAWLESPHRRGLACKEGTSGARAAESSRAAQLKRIRVLVEYSMRTSAVKLVVRRVVVLCGTYLLYG